MDWKNSYEHMMNQVHPEEGLFNGVLEEAAEQKKIVKRRWQYLAVTAAACLCLFVSLPVAAANVPEIYQLMHLVSPELAQFFMPVQKSDEHNGVRMEVVSAYVHDNEAQIYITMKDLTGDSFDETIDLYDSYYLKTPFERGVGWTGGCSKAGYDPETKTATYLITLSKMSLSEADTAKITGKKLTFGVRGFLSDKKEYEALPIPLDISDAEKEPETMEHNLNGAGGGKPGGVRRTRSGNVDTVLVPGEPDDSFLPKGIEYTGMGYVDGRLHVQFAVENSLQNDNHGYFFLRDKDGNNILYDYSLHFAENVDSPDRVDYMDCVFVLPEEELEQCELYGYFVTSGELKEGNWQVTFPLEEG